MEMGRESMRVQQRELGVGDIFCVEENDDLASSLCCGVCLPSRGHFSKSTSFVQDTTENDLHYHI